MIAKASCVSHGYNAINYAIRKNDAKYLNSNCLPFNEISPLMGFNNPVGIWLAMQCRKNSKVAIKHRNLKNDIIRIEIAPSLEEAATLKTDEDWNELLQEWMAEIEKIANKEDEECKPKSLDFQNSQWIAIRHYDSGKPHIHLIVNRVREDGNINKDNFIGWYATKAANAVNKQRNWKQPTEVHNEKIEKIYNDAIDVLKAMPKFDWTDFKRRMETKGCQVLLKRNKEGKVVSYRIDDGNSSYKASEIGPGKNLTAAHIFVTWLKEHPETQYNKDKGEKIHPEGQNVRPETEENRPVYQPVGVEKMETIEEHQKAIKAMPNSVTIDYDTDDGRKEISLPKEIYDEIENSAYDTDERGEHVADMDNEVLPLAAILWQAAAAPSHLLIAYIDAGTQITEGGGGDVHGELSSWGRDPNEDLFELARRAGRTASRAMTSRSRGRGRGRR